MAEKVIFAPEEEQFICRTAYGVWDNIGYDLLQCVAESEEKDINKVTIKRDEVIEVVLDAGRLEEELKRYIKTSNPVMTQDLLDRWKSASYEQKIAVVKSAFTCARYGM